MILFTLVLWIQHEARSLDWERIQQVSSPDGAHTLAHYRSHSEAGQAPYGDAVVLESPRNYPSAGKGETVFAGYCDALSMAWTTGGIEVRCKAREPAVSQAVMLLGVPVEVVIDEVTPSVTAGETGSS